MCYNIYISSVIIYLEGLRSNGDGRYTELPESTPSQDQVDNYIKIFEIKDYARRIMVCAEDYI